MEEKLRFTLPTSIHDIRYHYTILSGIDQKGGKIENNVKTKEYLRTLINNYNDSKASKFGFSYKPREINIGVIKNILYELKKLSLISEKEKQIALTDEGNRIVSLIKQKDSKQLKRVFAKIMLNHYTILPYFLRQIKVSPKREIPIPFITKGVLDKYENNPEATIEECLDVLSSYCPTIRFDVSELHDMLRSKNINLIDKRANKLKKLQAIIEKYVIMNVFERMISSRRAYDVIRSRTTYLDLTNHGIFNIDGYSAEIIYLISDFEPSFPYNQEEIKYSKGDIYINYPRWEDLKARFKISVLNNYLANRDSLGYAMIAEVRDSVCKELRISDSLFDLFLKNLYKEEPPYLSFTYFGAEDKITEKRLPIVFEKPMRQLFTRLKVNMENRRGER